MPCRRITAAAAVLAALLARPASAQLPHLMPPGSSWIDLNYPKVFWTPREGFTAGGYVGFIRQLDIEAQGAAPPYGAAVSLDGQLSTSGSRHLRLEGRFPAFLTGWRFVGTMEAVRRARDNYFGIGNGTSYDEDLVTDAQERYYQARSMRWMARGEVQRNLTAHLRALAGFHLEHARLDPLGPGILAAELAAGVDPTIGRGTADVAARAGLVFDTRDDDVAANSGILVQAIQTLGRTAGAGYTRTTVSAAAYRPLTENLIVAARAVAQGMGGTPRLNTYGLIESADRPFDGLGGALSHRALFDNRLLGRHKLLFNFDARYHVVNYPQVARVTVVAFVDAGRVFQNEGFALTTSGMKVGGGGGLFLQLFRGGIVGMTLGVGPDGATMNFASRWTY